uniref:Extradiol ring-cleavage dioxygenase class III enzyme subunit B domain-containing protein n=1 Tax=Globisporangium ultimum (strain ATCC 200006 / CBS 805.95 / DAOM BR144) TaxID=431595 RepID=K3WK34_GLOUD
MSAFRHPVVAVSHGPGPLWLLKDGFMGMNSKCVAAQNVRTTFPKIYQDASHPLPKRILFVTAHWESESKGFEISSSKNPDMIYDYYGFPSEAYDIVYAAKGEPEFAQKVKDALAQHKIDAKLVDRGFDHGVYVPMSLIRPEADIPIVSMSINDSLSPKAHFELGKVLKSFRDDETLVICSGQATHNMRASRDPNDPISEWAQGFQDWMDKVFSSASTLSYSQREAEIETWHKTAPFARLAHPTPDHFSPFIVAAGAGMDDSEPAGEKIIDGWGTGQFSFASYAWGIHK